MWILFLFRTVVETKRQKLVNIRRHTTRPSVYETQNADQLYLYVRS